MKGKKEEINKNLKKEKSKQIECDRSHLIFVTLLTQRNYFWEPVKNNLNDLYSWNAEMSNITIIIIKKEEQRLSMQE